MEQDGLLMDFNTIKVIKSDNEKLDDMEFRRLQLVQLSMLKELDRVCRANDIKYSIFSGTLLGAVRHNGYIPWDDDTDVVFLREEYEKFKKVSDQLDRQICYFQDHETDHQYLWGYGKVRKTGTSHVRYGQEHIECQNGVYLDIFPLDDVPISVLGQMIQDFYCFIHRKILWAKVGKKSEKGIKKLWYTLISCISTETVHRHMRKYIAKSNNSTPNRVRTLLFPAYGKIYKKNPIRERYGMPKSWFLELADYRFEDGYFKGIGDSDGFLTYYFGNYMELPPVEQRIPKVSYSHIEY